MPGPTAGKGDRRRPAQVPLSELDARWAMTFGPRSVGEHKNIFDLFPDSVDGKPRGACTVVCTDCGSTRPEGAGYHSECPARE